MGQNTLKEFEVEFKLIQERVEFLLEHNENARNDDTTLVFLYWGKFEKFFEFSRQMELVYDNYSNLFDLKGKLTPAESITRARRIIQNELKKYEAKQETKFERIERQEAIKEFMIKRK